MPDNVKAVKISNPRTFTLVLDRAYSPIWFTGNQLSQLMPIPQHVWDKKSASGAGRQLGHDDRRREGRLQLPDRRGQEDDARTPRTRSGRSSTARGSCPSTAPTATRAFVPNPQLLRAGQAEARRSSSSSRSRPQQAELNVAALGRRRLRLPAAVGGRAGEGPPAQGYTFAPWIAWGINYMPFNFAEPDRRADLQAAVHPPGAADG